MTTFTKLTTVDASKFQPGELIHMDFEFYNLTPIRVFTSMINVVCEKTIIMWVFSHCIQNIPCPHHPLHINKNEK